jgi:hypothetical protein
VTLDSDGADIGMVPVPLEEQAPEEEDDEPDEPVFDDPDDEYPEDDGDAEGEP